jgi:hypothetical protein
VLLAHVVRRAASRELWIAGINKAINSPMIAITASNSTSVKAPRCRLIWRRKFVDPAGGLLLVCWLNIRKLAFKVEKPSAAPLDSPNLSVAATRTGIEFSLLIGFIGSNSAVVANV